MKNVDFTVTSLNVKGENFAIGFKATSQKEKNVIAGKIENVHFSTKGTFDLEQAVLVFDTKEKLAQQDIHDVLDALLNTVSYAKFYKFLDKALVQNTADHIHFDQQQIEQA